jgi:hypothetical protein
MFDELNRAIDEYQNKWNALVAQRKNKEFFERLKPTTVGWKVADLAEYDRLKNEWRGACDLVFEKWMNERWIAEIHLKDTKLSGGIEVIKLMQRRPNSSDALGLDNMDFMDMEETNTKAVLSEEGDLKYTDEANGLCAWISIWFDGTEAKLRQGTPLDVAIDELREVNSKIRGKFIPSHEANAAAVAEVE